MMKKYFLITFLSIMVVCSCKSTTDTVVSTNSQKEKTPTLDEGTWELVNIRGRSPRYKDSENPITIKFNLESKTISGFSGCNRYFGNIQLLTTEGKIKFEEIGATKRACPQTNMDFENSFLQQLGKINSYILSDKELQLKITEREIFIFEKKQQN